MMAQETVNPRLIKSNVDLYAKILKRPMVNEKLLSRPPFKFLHDLITIVIKNNGYLRGLYVEDQFQLDNINTKEAKMAFLDRLIDAVGFIYGKAVDVKSAKIIAGLEATKTNKLLNDLAKAINDRKPFLQAVDSVRKGLKPPEADAGSSAKTTTTTTTNAATSRKASTGNVQTKAPAKSTIPSRQNPGATNRTAATKQPTNNKAAPKEKTVEKKPAAEKASQKAQPESEQEIVDERPKTQEIVKGKRNVETEEKVEIEENIPEPVNRLEIVPNQGAEESPKENVEIEQALAREEKEVNEDKDGPKSLVEHKEEQESVKTPPKKEREKSASKTLPSKQVVVEEGSISQKSPSQTKQNTARIQEPEKNRTMKRDKSSKPIKSEPEPVIPEKASLPLRSARPGSSRPAPPRVMTASRNRLQRILDNRTAATTAPGQASPTSTATPTTTNSPQVWPPPEGLALDLNADNDDNADDYTINTDKLQETMFATLDDSNATAFNGSSGAGDAMPSKGRLMQQLMANKSVLEGTKTPGQADSSAVSQTATPTDTAQLRTFVRELCQSVATLTKAVNYLHEDVDPMMSELSQWRQEYRQNLTQIEQLRTETDKQLQPLQSELDKLDKEVQEFKDKLQNAKANVFRNGININKLIESI